MAWDFTGKRALVTGAGKGIGREIARTLAQAGAEVVALSRTAADLVTLHAEIECQTLTADLADGQSAQRAARDAGAIDLLVNNAGISLPQSFLTTDLESWEATFAVNVRAAFLISQVGVLGPRT